MLPLIQFNYSRVNPVPVKSLAKALGMPAGNLRKPYINMTGKALRQGVELVKKLGLIEQYNYKINEAAIVDRFSPAEKTSSANHPPPTGSGKCFID